VFGLSEEHVINTPAHRQHLELGPVEADEVLLAKILAYAPTTWASHANSFKEFANFVAKVCPKNSNLKQPFGSFEVRKMWNYIEKKYPALSRVPIVTLRTFVLAVVQYHSFCRFSDLAVVKLSDVVFDVDYFKIVIEYSKTDQAGAGQNAYVLKSADKLRNPHMLMCLYLRELDSYDVPDLFLFPPLI
jgi:hypothetical protein